MVFGSQQIEFKEAVEFQYQKLSSLNLTAKIKDHMEDIFDPKKYGTAKYFKD